MVADHGFIVVEGVLQDGERVHVGGVAEGDGDVSQIAASLGAGDGSPLEALIKGLGSESQLARRKRKRFVIRKSGIPFRRESIPWADHLADVASKNPIAYFFAQFNRDVVFEFDGEIGDAARRVECAVWQNAIGGAGGDATRACAAMVGDEWRIGLEFEVEKNFGDEKIRALFWMDEASVLSDPADARALGEIAFEDGTGIRVISILYRMFYLLLDEADELLHSSGEDSVIIFAARVGGNLDFTLTLSSP